MFLWKVEKLAENSYTFKTTGNTGSLLLQTSFFVNTSNLGVEVTWLKTKTQKFQ